MKHLSTGGYVRVFRPEHPRRSKSGYIYEHTAVMEEALGRFLTPEENVHHRNGVRTENRLENLELWSKSQPAGQRVEDKLTWARELIATYEGMEK